MANKKNKPTKESAEIEKSNEVLELDKSRNKKTNSAKVDQKKLKQKKLKKSDKPKRNFAKEVVSELKKVNWPSFKNACKQTGAVLVVVGVFMLAVLGIDSLVAWILNLITRI